MPGDWLPVGLCLFAMTVLCIVLVWVLRRTNDEPQTPNLRHKIGDDFQELTSNDTVEWLGRD